VLTSGLMGRPITAHTKDLRRKEYPTVMQALVKGCSRTADRDPRAQRLAPRRDIKLACQVPDLALDLGGQLMLWRMGPLYQAHRLQNIQRQTAVRAPTRTWARGTVIIMPEARWESA